MPETFKDFSPREICIALTGRVDDNFEHVKEGDIVTVRKPLSYIGRNENNRHLWLLVDGRDSSFMDSLNRNLTEPLDPADATTEVQIFEKRRYCIPLDRLKVLALFIDLNRLRDRDDQYQPMIPLEQRSVSENIERKMAAGVNFLRMGVEGLSDEGKGSESGTSRRPPSGVIGEKPLDIHGLIYDKGTMDYL